MNTPTHTQALEALCSILNKTGFTLDGGTADPDYLKSAERYAHYLVETFHTNAR